jgi:signal transduction histidine kinase
MGFQHNSGRVIALGRLLMSILFLLAISLDSSQPTRAPSAAYALLIAYFAFSGAIAIATWSNWWLDAKLVGPVHAIDVTLFALLVLLTEGYTSPYFAYFMFVLMAAAIRWDWHATALTAILLTLLFMIVGLAVLTSGGEFNPQRFIVRTGHLVIFSVILVWFCANQRWAQFRLGAGELLAGPSLDASPVETGLRSAMAAVGASRGSFSWREAGRDGVLLGLAVDEGGIRDVKQAGDAMAKAIAASPFLYDIARDRAIRKDSGRNLIDFPASELLAPASAAALHLSEGMAVPVRSDEGEGMLFLERVRGLSTDHIDAGDQLADAIAIHFQRYALLGAAEESAEARSRLTLARDLHDSVVQFLAGAAFRLEAMKRSGAAGSEFESDLDELKQLMLHEQDELRSFITSLRSGPLIAFNDLARQLQLLADRLAKQWDIACPFEVQAAELMVPTRIRVDTQQMMREAVANAVRHAAAKSVTIRVAALPHELKLEFINDGKAYPRKGGKMETPASLRERVEQAGGSLDMARGMGVTKLSVSLPISGLGR